MTALAYNESQPRADNGEFGEGSGGSHKSPHKPKGRAHDAHARHAVAKSRLAEAVTDHHAAVASHHAAAANVHNIRNKVATHVASFRTQDAKDRAHAPEVIAHLKDRERSEKTEAKQAQAKVKSVLHAHGLSEQDNHNIVSHADAESSLKRASADVVRRKEAIEAEQDPHAKRNSQDVLDRITLPAEARARQRANDLAEKSEAARAKLTPEERQTLIDSVAIESKADATRDERKAVEKGLKNADKHAALHDALGNAAASGDSKAMKRAHSKIDSTGSLRSALDETGNDGYSIPDDLSSVADDHAEASIAEERARRKADRTARAVRAHEREVKRTAPK